MLDASGKLISREIRIENTNACNAACIMCPREQMTRRIEIMCYGMFCNLIQQAKKMGVTDASVFGFGEPLIDPGLADKLAYATEAGLTAHITTNGALLTEYKAHDLLDAGLKNIRLGNLGVFLKSESDQRYLIENVDPGAF